MSDRPSQAEGIDLKLPHTVQSEQSDGNCSAPPDQSTLEWFDLFHKWDFITAEATEGKPKWITFSKFPLSRETLYQRWENPAEFVGVRFKCGQGTTRYAMLDVDNGSQYHPQENLSAIPAISNALETIGICRHIKVRSSDSGGLHLYFPLPGDSNCYRLAVALQQTLQKHDFQIKPGQLEIFPNVKARRSNYQAHRLPLQLGSFVLDDDFQPVHNSLRQFIQTWNAVAEQQDLVQLAEVVAKAKQHRLSSSKNQEEWKKRLETSLTTGFTGHSQTNQLVQEACTYLRVFERLEWDEVTVEAYGVITNLPGYKQYCEHQKEIRRRIRDWVKTNQKSGRYRPASNCPKVKERPKAPSNEVRSEDALKRIKQAIAFLTESDGLPDGVKARQAEICKIARCSATTLRKHNELWHPDFQIEGCVTTELPTLAAILTTPEDQSSLSDRTMPLCSDQKLGCVTTDSSTVSAKIGKVSKNETIAETQSNQLVTHPALLSVYSVSGLAETSASNDRADRSISNQPSKQSFKFPVGSIVKWQQEQELLKITAINPNGTCWAKWLNPPVPRIAVILKESEIELANAEEVAEHQSKFWLDTSAWTRSPST